MYINPNNVQKCTLRWVRGSRERWADDAKHPPDLLRETWGGRGPISIPLRQFHGQNCTINGQKNGLFERDFRLKYGKMHTYVHYLSRPLNTHHES